MSLVKTRTFSNRFVDLLMSVEYSSRKKYFQDISKATIKRHANFVGDMPATILLLYSGTNTVLIN